MKKVDIKKQPRLGLKKTASLTINGIRYRLFRSTVTMIVITVAIAFLMNSLSESLIKRSVARQSRNQIRSRRLATTWVARVSSPGSKEDIIAFSGRLKKGTAPYKETQAFGKMDDAQMAEFLERVRRASEYLTWFEELSYDDRRQLVHQALGTQILDRLCDGDDLERFHANLKKMPSLRFIDKDPAVFKDYLKTWPKTRKRVEQILAARKSAIAKLGKLMEGKEVMLAMCDANGGFGDKIRSVGFELDKETAEIIATQASAMQQQRLLEKRIGEMGVRKEVAKEIDVLPQDVSSTLLWDELLTSKRRARWTMALVNSQWALEKGLEDKALAKKVAELTGLKAEGLAVKDALAKMMKDLEKADTFLGWDEVKKLNVGINLTPGAAVTLAENKEEIEKYIKADRLCADVSEKSFLGLGKRMGWLLLVSLLVCIVGIANAMLMTVTERFREIATLKCLGALDGFIMTMFVMEACVLGVFGGFFGSIVGGIIGLGRMRVAFGDILFEAMQPQDLLIACLIAVVMGVIMAAMAAVYPSFKASRMAPMEAMRID